MSSYNYGIGNFKLINTKRRMNTISRKRATSLTQELVNTLRALIDQGALVPGDKLPTESALMQEYGVSRTVVREAISKLQAAGLAETRHGVGTFILAASNGMQLVLDATELSTLEDVIEMLELRISLEVEAPKQQVIAILLRY